MSSVATNNEMEKLHQYTKLLSVYSEVVHELQKERGMTAGFLSSKGEKFSSELPRQRSKTIDKIEKKSNYWRNNQFDNKQIQQLNNTINQRLTKLEVMLIRYPFLYLMRLPSIQKLMNYC